MARYGTRAWQLWLRALCNLVVVDIAAASVIRSTSLITLIISKFQSYPKIQKRSTKIHSESRAQFLQLINSDQLGSTWAPGNLPKDQRPVVHRHAHGVCHKVLTGKICRKLRGQHLVDFLHRRSVGNSKLPTAQYHGLILGLCTSISCNQLCFSARRFGPASNQASPRILCGYMYLI